MLNNEGAEQRGALAGVIIYTPSEYIEYTEGRDVHSVEYRPKKEQAWWRIGPLKAMEISRIYFTVR